MLNSDAYDVEVYLELIIVRINYGYSLPVELFGVAFLNIFWQFQCGNMYVCFIGHEFCCQLTARIRSMFYCLNHLNLCL